MRMSRAWVAEAMDADLRERVFPHWRDMVDETPGGYRQTEVHPCLSERLRADARAAKRRLGALLRRRPPPPRGKDLVTQSRLLWTLSIAHRMGHAGDRESYRRAADHGYRFLTARLLDPRHGGYAWIADRSGRIVDSRKTLYGQAFALYALIEYHRATGSAEPLERAVELFEVIQERMHDEANGGWVEHGAADFTPLEPGTLLPALPTIGMKTGNAHLHWMEALSELADVTGAAAVRSALEEALEINGRYFYPAEPETGSDLRTPDWRRVPVPAQEPVSYGHNVEFAWLMLRAEEVLGAGRSWEHFDALLRHALRWGFDHERGGFYDRGPAVGPATRKSKVWWVQAEGLAALTDAVRHRGSREYEDALDLLSAWILGSQRLSDGLWVPIVDSKGKRRSSVAPAAWKGGYHEVRAMIRFVQEFGSAG